MDKHLNLFYSYNQGKIDSLERIKQLENNLTRAVITTLLNLTDEIQRKIIFEISKTPDQVLTSKNFKYDLQNTKQDVKKIARKFLLILQRDESEVTKGSLMNSPKKMEVNEKILNILDENIDSEKRKELTAKIGNSYKKQENFEHDDLKIDFTDLGSYLDLLHGNIPDAWIIGSEEVFLIETKIGNNKVSDAQIYRHLTGKNGFNISHQKIKNSHSSTDYNLVTLTWKELVNILKEIITQKDHLEKDKFLITQLIEYITMTGQIMNFDYILENPKHIEREMHKNQLQIFLTELDKELKKRKIDLVRGNRPLSGYLWDYYGVKKEDGEASKDPHYSIGFGDTEITIYLATKNVKTIHEDVVAKIIAFRNKDLSFRYFLSLSQYNLVDHQKGQIKGEFYEPFKFHIKFSAIKDKQDAVSKVILEFSKNNFYKQFDFGFSIQLFDFSKNKDSNENNTMREANAQILRKPEELVKQFADFIEQTYYIFELMRAH